MAIFSAVIPKYHQEFASGSDQLFMGTSKPVGADRAIAVRINDITSGTSCSLRMAGVLEVYDNLVAGEILPGEFDQMTNANTDIDSIIVWYV